MNPFLKLIPTNERKKHTGMNILLHSDVNVAGQPTTMMRLINEHTIHKARCVIYKGDYLAYDKDIEIVPANSRDADADAISEAAELANQADFFHIYRRHISIPGIDWMDLLEPRNCLFQYLGSIIRNYKDKPCVKFKDQMLTLHEFHETFDLKQLNYCDQSMLDYAGSAYYHWTYPFIVGNVPKADPPTDRVVICHAPTNREIKQTEPFLKVMDRIMKKHKNVELELIEGVTNKECLERKKRAHIVFDSLSDTQGLYGLTATESAAMGQVVLCALNAFTFSFFPDCPFIPVRKSNIEEVLERLVTHPEEVKKRGEEGRKWVERMHDPIRSVKQMVFLYEAIMNPLRNIESAEAFFL